MLISLKRNRYYFTKSEIYIWISYIFCVIVLYCMISMKYFVPLKQLW